MSPAKITISSRTIDCPLQDSISAYVSGNRPLTAYAVTDNSSLYRICTDNGDAIKLLDLAKGIVAPGHNIELIVGFEDQYLAVTYQEKDNHEVNRGFIINLKTNDIVMSLDIGDYRTGHTRYPIAFCMYNNKPVVIHGTDWNRIDATELTTASLLTHRDLADAPEEADDWNCFSEWNGHIAVSPDQRRAACVGWVWHPVGLVYSWRLDNWLNGNPFEVDVSEEKQSHAAWDYFWDSEIAWVDNERLAIWSGHEMARELNTPHVSIVNVNDESQHLIIEGPENHFYIQNQVLIGKVENTVALWCCNTGLPLGRFQGELINYHHIDREWLTIEGKTWRFTHWEMDTATNSAGQSDEKP